MTLPTSGEISGHWTSPPVFATDGVQVRATIEEEGGAVNGVTGTGTSYDWRSLPLSIGVNSSTSSSVTWKIEMRTGAGEVQDTFDVTVPHYVFI